MCSRMYLLRYLMDGQGNGLLGRIIIFFQEKGC